ncbi:MAG TPA: TIR domain-containing protein [Solirubrobacterales bacterium]|nr:TIR domain-containing protein [Solirubrobacterales bacterium]
MEGEAGVDFFVSYTGPDQPWAEWISWQLERASYRVKIQAWDFRPGANFVVAMHEASQEASTTLCVLSPAFLESPYCTAEWAAAFRGDPEGRGPAVIPVRVQPCQPDGLLGPIVYIDLVGVSEQEARDLLLTGVNGQRAKPLNPPPYPSGHLPPNPSPPFPQAGAPIWNIPSPTRTFMGRDAALEAIDAKLTRNARIAVTQVNAVHGLGGVGKTQLASRYAHNHRARYEVGWWVRSESRATLIDDFCQLGVALGLFSENQGFDDAAAEIVKRWLEGNEHWLVVFDNVPAPEDLSGLLPDGTSGEIMITSRRHADWRSLAAEPIALDVWERQESVAFILARTGSTDTTTADVIAERFGDLPLALEQAACYINQQAIDLEEYDRRWQKLGTKLLARGQPLSYEHTVIRTWQMAIEVLADDAPSANVLLAVCSMFAPEAIPRSLLSGLAGDVDDAIEALLSYGLISASPTSVDVHRLVQHVLREALLNSPSVGDAVMNMAGKLMSEAFPDDVSIPEDWSLSRQLAPHAEALLQLLGEPDRPGPGGKAARLYFILGCWATTQERWEDACQHFERALGIEAKVYGEKHPLSVRTYGNFAASLLGAGRPEDAKPHFTTALELERQIWGEGSIEVASTEANFALLYYKAGQSEKAKTMLQRAVEAFEKSSIEDLEPHRKSQFVHSRLNLSKFYGNAGAPDKQAQELSRAKKDAELFFKTPHPALSDVEAELGKFHLESGEHDLAR